MPFSSPKHFQDVEHMHEFICATNKCILRYNIKDSMSIWANFRLLIVKFAIYFSKRLKLQNIHCMNLILMPLWGNCCCSLLVFSYTEVITEFPNMKPTHHIFFLLLLVLLFSALSLCGATEYYVRPTESTDTSCPRQPCLTLSQYISESIHFFKSNTVFKFLSGTHRVNASVMVRNVHNISLLAEGRTQPQVITYCPSKCSSNFESGDCPPDVLFFCFLSRM